MINKNTLNKRKAVMLLLSVLVLVVAVIGGTIAFMTSGDTPIINVFRRSVVSSRVNESFNGTMKSNVSIQNTGDTTSYIRAAIVVTWKNAENGAVYARKPIAGEDYIITLNETDWFLGDDGFYYHKAPIAKDSSTATLIYNCCPVEPNTPPGYGLNVEILGSAIQSVPTRIVTSNWNVSVDNSGYLQK